MSSTVVRCRCWWLITAACTVAVTSCAGPNARTHSHAGSATGDGVAAGHRSLALPIGATLLELTHTVGTEATSWIDTDLRSVYRPTRPNGVEVGFVASESTAESRSFGADRAAGEHSRGPTNAVQQAKPRRLAAPLLVVDMCGRTARNRDAELRVEDIETFELLHGEIDPGSAVLVRTCWYWRWANRARYLGTGEIGPVGYHFPGVSWQAANALIERKVAAVAIDTAGVDHGPTKGRVVQQTLEQAHVEVFVNLIAYQELPTRGALLLALPMKIPGSDRTPMRVLALTP